MPVDLSKERGLTTEDARTLARLATRAGAALADFAQAVKEIYLPPPQFSLGPDPVIVRIPEEILCDPLFPSRDAMRWRPGE